MDFLKSIAGRLVTGILALGVVSGGISWFQMTPDQRQSVLQGFGKGSGWLLAVLLIPWATFFLSARVGRMQSNLAGGVLVAGYTLIEAVGLFWLFDWSIQGSVSWVFVIVGILLAGLYNLLVCDWIAEKFE